MGEEERRLQEGGTGDGGGGPSGSGTGKGAGDPGRRRGEGDRGIAASEDGCSEEAGEVEWAEQDGGQPEERAQGSGVPESRPPAAAVQTAGYPAGGGERVQERAWTRIRDEAARLEERDREVAERERRVRVEEEAAARGVHRVIVDPEGNNPPTDTEGGSPSEKRARVEVERGRHVRVRQRRLEEQGARCATGAAQPASPSPEPTRTDWGSEYQLPRRYGGHPAQRVPGTVRGWRAGDVAGLVRYVKWAGRTRGGRERRGTHPFCDPVHRAGRPQDKRPQMAEARWRWMLGEVLPGVDLEGSKESGTKPRVRMLRELLQREGWY